MGHRHFYRTSPMFENNPDLNWNHIHTQQHYTHLGRTGTSDYGSFSYPLENMSTESISFPSHWNSAARSNGYASSSVNIEAPPHQSYTSRTSHNNFLHSSSAGTFFAVPGNSVPQPSNYHRQSFPVVDGGFNNPTLTRGQGPHKRKRHEIPSVYESGGTSRHFNAGSASDLPSSSELRLMKPNMDPRYIPGDRVTVTPSFRGSGLPIRGGDSLRNVRSRFGLDLESNLQRTHLSSNHRHNSYPTGLPFDHSRPVDLSSQTSSNLTRDWSQMNINPAHGRVLSSDSSVFSHETRHFLVGRHSSNAPVHVGGFHNDFGTRRNHSAPQNFHNYPTQSARRVHSNYSQRPNPTFSASSSFRWGHVAPSDHGLHIVAESYSARHPRQFSSVDWRSSDRNGRSRMYSDRYQSMSDEFGLNDRFSSEGFMIVDRASLYSPMNIHDQHRDMRMDIDNMSYEELLALGERIGNVSTGLSEDLMSKYLTITIYSSAEQTEEGTCAICLEEYKNMDEVGTLKTCRHDYHVSCIRKWLSMKNVCPICKASALPDDMKDK